MNASSGRSTLTVTASSVGVRVACCLNHQSRFRCRWLAAALFLPVSSSLLGAAKKRARGERWVAASGPVHGSAPSDL